jgi:pyridoxine/pyridoxamine 5'-phosphate oxidase
MLEALFQECNNKWTQVKNSKKHAFRFFTLATIASDGSPHLRTVVLRDFNPKDISFTMYTDSRSQKLQELEQDKRAQLLFYDPKRMLQIIVSVVLLENVNEDKIYNDIPEQSKKDYSSMITPGSEIKSPDKLRFNFSKGYFSKLIFKAETIEYLRLKRPNHLRAFFKIEDNWKGTFLVP